MQRKTNAKQKKGGTRAGNVDGSKEGAGRNGKKRERERKRMRKRERERERKKETRQKLESSKTEGGDQSMTGTDSTNRIAALHTFPRRRPLTVNN